MIELDAPTMSARLLYETCAAGVGSASKKARYFAASSGIDLADSELTDAAAALDFGSVVSDRCPSSEVSKEMMDHLYDGQLVRRKSKARLHYDNLRASAPNGVCPYCSHRRVAALDHYMPKSRFPDLAVNPANLIPICSDCNKLKLSEIPGHSARSPLHPYFDRLGDVVWLRADVVETSPSALRYWVDVGAFDDSALAARVKAHLDALCLGELYAAEAATELLNIRHQLERLSAAGSGAPGVRMWLGEMEESCAQANPNGWRTAAFAAWGSSSWFCEGGFA
jgi:hypothetical protein